MSEFKKWYSFAETGDYQGFEPNFFDISQKEWAKQLVQHQDAILKEFEKINAARDKNIIPYFNQTLASKAENWNIFPLYVWSKKRNENCEKCPVTTKLIESIPGMTSCSFSILKADTSIKPHHGDSNVMYRAHLTLNSPGALPEIGMRVRTEQISWKNGEIFAFCDAYEHEVWNKTNSERWVLIVDVLREEVVAQQKKICSEVNATLFWQLKFQKFYFIKHLPEWCRKLLMEVTAIFY